MLNVTFNAYVTYNNSFSEIWMETSQFRKMLTYFYSYVKDGRASSLDIAI